MLSLLVILIFFFSVIAHYVFSNVENDDGTLSFVTLEDSCLAMYQTFIGEGWHGIMEDAVNKTNKAMIWFFAFYVLVVGVIFSNLFVGMLISLFQKSTEDQSSVEGQVKLQLEQYFKSELHDNDEADRRFDFNEIILDLGQIAHTMHFQPDHHSGTGTRFNLSGQRSRQQRKDETIEEWMGRIMLKALRNMMIRKTSDRTRVLLRRLQQYG